MTDSPTGPEDEPGWASPTPPPYQAPDDDPPGPDAPAVGSGAEFGSPPSGPVGGPDVPPPPPPPGPPGYPAAPPPPPPGPWVPTGPAVPYAPGAPYAPGGAMTPGSNGLAIASLITGIFGFFCFVPAILAIVFGYIARNQIKQSGGVQGGRGMATAGIVLGWIWIALTVVYVVALTAARA